MVFNLNTGLVELVICFISVPTTDLFDTEKNTFSKVTGAANWIGNIILSPHNSRKNFEYTVLHFTRPTEYQHGDGNVTCGDGLSVGRPCPESQLFRLQSDSVDARTTRTQAAIITTQRSTCWYHARPYLDTN